MQLAFDETSFDDILKKYEIVIMKVGAMWCGPCRALDRLLEHGELSPQLAAEFEKREKQIALIHDKAKRKEKEAQLEDDQQKAKADAQSRAFLTVHAKDKHLAYIKVDYDDAQKFCTSHQIEAVPVIKMWHKGKIVEFETDEEVTDRKGRPVIDPVTHQPKTKKVKADRISGYREDMAEALESVMTYLRNKPDA